MVLVICVLQCVVGYQDDGKSNVRVVEWEDGEDRMMVVRAHCHILYLSAV